MSEVLENLMVELEFTPNPNTLKYVCSIELLDKGAYNFPTLSSAEGKSPIAVALFSLPDIAGVMVGKNFVTVTIANDEHLTTLNEKIIACIKDFFKSGEKALLDAYVEEEKSKESSADLNDIEKKIVQILDDEIRPAVAMDGGDISFAKFEDGFVYLHMKGACAGCPSSTATLKMGIENRLKDAIPEVQEVVAV